MYAMVRSLVDEGSDADKVTADLDVSEQQPAHLVVLEVTTLAGPVSADEHRATDHVVCVFHMLNNNHIRRRPQGVRRIFFAFLFIVTIAAVM